MPKSAQPKLGELQRQMLDTIRTPMRPGQRMQKSGGEVAERLIAPNSRLTSFERLEIYNRQYWFRVVECIYEDYPGVRAVLGERRFRNLAIAYLANHPSTSFTLRNLGRHLAEFIAAKRCGS